jgi:pimeloyl-ACP methyl ester carboxylesterase
METGTRRLLALAAAVAGGIIFNRYRRELGEIRRRVREGRRVADTAAGTIEYAVEGSGPPVLVIHGAGGGYDQGLLLGQNFAGFRVIAPSRFGYLGTPTPLDISPAAQADAHAALLDTLGVDKVVVAGVSAGAPSTVQLALRHPERVRGLVLIVPRGYAPGQAVDAAPRHEPSVLRVIMSGADFAYWAAARIARSRVLRFLGVPPEVEARAAPAERERVNAIIRSVLPLSMRINGIRNDSAITLGPLPVERIQAPTLIISARDDLFSTLPAAKYLAERIPGAKLVVLDSGGHLMVGRQVEVTGAVASFLEGLRLLEANMQPLRKSA